MIRLVSALLLASLFAPHASAQSAPPLDYTETPPELVGGIEALQSHIVYPEAERRAGTEGRVIVQFVVDPDGRASDIRVARSVSPGLDSASVRAVRASRFSPGIQDGQAVRVRMTLPVTFRIRPDDADDDADDNADDIQPGRPWQTAFEARIDSGAVVDGRGTVWVLSDAFPSGRVLAAVDDGQIVEVTVETNAEDGEMAAYVEQMTVPTRADGFYHAVDLVSAGFPAVMDIRVDPETSRATFRIPRCATSSTYPDCVSLWPQPLGGFSRIAARIPRGARDRRRMRVEVSVRVAPDGTLASAEIVEGAGDEARISSALRAAILDALRGTTFQMGLPGTDSGDDAGGLEAVSFPLTVPAR